ncbi:MAG: 4-hydroxy-3-methylbut-2-enyl diphosphate reductase [Patescibacteria group bacterium]|nr:4-hydroxy-3-methylbut-2-enyl diphosphate reductase [Patescibacteria group bacterium]
MKIILATSGGFCSGVKRAYNLIKSNHKKYTPPIQILGDLVHNSHVIAETKSWGINKVTDPKTIKRGTLIIPAHGCDPKIFSLPNFKKVNLVDATCPKVSKIIERAKLLAQEGKQVLIFGDENHVEVQATNAAINNQGIIISKFSQLDSFLKQAGTNNKKQFGLIAQTTQNIEDYEKIKKCLKKSNLKVEILDTICTATRHRQKEAFRLAKEVDLMIIIGSPSSANSTRLYQIAKKINKRTYFIDSPAEINNKQIKPNDIIGISAGASTPDYIIKAVKQKIEQMAHNQ